MPPWVILIIIFLLNLITGWQILHLLDAPDLDWLERIFISFALGTAVIGTTALILAELGQFHIITLALIWLLVLLGLLFANHKSQAPVSPKNRLLVKPQKTQRIQFALLLLWLMAALWLFFRPHEFIIGGADAGVKPGRTGVWTGQGGVKRWSTGG